MASVGMHSDTGCCDRKAHAHQISSFSNFCGIPTYSREFYRYPLISLFWVNRLDKSDTSRIPG